MSRFSSTIHNPKIDAKTWALDVGDRGDEGETTAERLSLSQDYSWYDAKKYFIKATPYTIPGSKTVKQGSGCVCDNGERINPVLRPMPEHDWWTECYNKCLEKCGCSPDDAKGISKCFGGN